MIEFKQEKAKLFPAFLKRKAGYEFINILFFI
jgi:hypothetical protein